MFLENNKKITSFFLFCSLIFSGCNVNKEIESIKKKNDLVTLFSFLNFKNDIKSTIYVDGFANLKNSDIGFQCVGKGFEKNITKDSLANCDIDIKSRDPIKITADRPGKFERCEDGWINKDTKECIFREDSVDVKIESNSPITIKNNDYKNEDGSFEDIVCSPEDQSKCDLTISKDSNLNLNKDDIRRTGSWTCNNQNYTDNNRDLVFDKVEQDLECKFEPTNYKVSMNVYDINNNSVTSSIGDMNCIPGEEHTDKCSIFVDKASEVQFYPNTVGNFKPDIKGDKVIMDMDKDLKLDFYAQDGSPASDILTRINTKRPSTSQMIQYDLNRDKIDNLNIESCDNVQGPLVHSAEVFSFVVTPKDENPSDQDLIRFIYNDWMQMYKFTNHKIECPGDNTRDLHLFFGAMRYKLTMYNRTHNTTYKTTTDNNIDTLGYLYSDNQIIKYSQSPFSETIKSDQRLNIASDDYTCMSPDDKNININISSKENTSCYLNNYFLDVKDSVNYGYLYVYEKDPYGTETMIIKNATGGYTSKYPVVRLNTSHISQAKDGDTLLGEDTNYSINFTDKLYKVVQVGNKAVYIINNSLPLFTIYFDYNNTRYDCNTLGCSRTLPIPTLDDVDITIGSSNPTTNIISNATYSLIKPSTFTCGNETYTLTKEIGKGSIMCSFK